MLIEAIDVQVDIQERSLFQTGHLSIHANDRIGLVGKNGSGKHQCLRVTRSSRTTTKNYSKNNIDKSYLLFYHQM